VVLDPETRSATICRGVTAVEQTTGELSIPETPIVLSLGDIFKVLDEYD
jgi:hypothetical protein